MKRWRKWAIVTASAGIAGVPIVAEIGPAAAHYPTIVGQTTCIENGQWSVTWTLRSWQADGEAWTIVGAGRTNFAYDVSLATLSPTGYIPDDQPFTLTETLPASVTSVRLWAEAMWQDGVTGDTLSDPVSPTVCTEPTTTTTAPTTTTIAATTTTTTAPTTTTIAATTTTTTAAATTTIAATTTTTLVGQQGPTTTITPTTAPVTQPSTAPPTTATSGQAPPTPPGSGVSLPRTGTDSTLTSLLTATLLLLGGLVITRLARAR